MFATRYFPDRYFAPRYFPKVGADPPVGGSLPFVWPWWDVAQIGSLEMAVSFNFAKAVTPSDTVNFDFGNGITSALYVGGTGNMVVVLQDGTAVTFTGVVAGSMLPLSAKRVNATSTTATNIVAIYQV
jgi:hypothetical protein